MLFGLDRISSYPQAFGISADRGGFFCTFLKIKKTFPTPTFFFISFSQCHFPKFPKNFTPGGGGVYFLPDWIAQFGIKGRGWWGGGATFKSFALSPLSLSLSPYEKRKKKKGHNMYVL